MREHVPLTLVFLRVVPFEMPELPHQTTTPRVQPAADPVVLGDPMTSATSLERVDPARVALAVGLLPVLALIALIALIRDKPPERVSRSPAASDPVASIGPSGPAAAAMDDLSSPPDAREVLLRIKLALDQREFTSLPDRHGIAEVCSALLRYLLDKEALALHDYTLKHGGEVHHASMTSLHNSHLQSNERSDTSTFGEMYRQMAEFSLTRSGLGFRSLDSDGIIMTLQPALLLDSELWPFKAVQGARSVIRPGHFSFHEAPGRGDYHYVTLILQGVLSDGQPGCVGLSMVYVGDGPWWPLDLTVGTDPGGSSPIPFF